MFSIRKTLISRHHIIGGKLKALLKTPEHHSTVVSGSSREPLISAPIMPTIVITGVFYNNPNRIQIS